MFSFGVISPVVTVLLVRAVLASGMTLNSNFNSIVYQTAEHYMMAEKARLFGNDTLIKTILNADNPGKAKKLGREVVGFDEQVWKKERTAIVVRGNHAKFSQNPELCEFLLNTGERVLVEASPRDRVWGIGLTKDDPQASSPENWQGLNLLGFALMEVRDLLSKGSDT